MQQQVSFLNLADISEESVLITDCLDSLKSKRAEKLYQELLKLSSKDNDKVIPLTYKYLIDKLGYEYISIRVALWELEKLSLITKTPARTSGSFYIKLNTNLGN